MGTGLEASGKGATVPRSNSRSVGRRGCPPEGVRRGSLTSFRPVSEEKSHMADILHRVGIKSSLDDVYNALTTREGLAGWWTNNTQGEGKVGGVLQFRFGAGGFDMKLLGLRPGKRGLWQVIDGPPEWIGTKVRWDLKQEGDYA